jgi:hypothetical protein
MPGKKRSEADNLEMQSVMTQLVRVLDLIVKRVTHANLSPIVAHLLQSHRPVTEPGKWKELRHYDQVLQSDIAKRFIDLQRSKYADTRNPLYAWRAFQEARGFDLPVPSWVLEYLDGAARNLYNLTSTKRRPSKAASAIAEAIGMKRKGKTGAGTVFSRHDETQDLMIACEVHWRLDWGHKLTYAYEYVADKHRISSATVSRAWNKYKKLFPRRRHDKKSAIN